MDYISAASINKMAVLRVVVVLAIAIFVAYMLQNKTKAPSVENFELFDPVASSSASGPVPSPVRPKPKLMGSVPKGAFGFSCSSVDRTASKERPSSAPHECGVGQQRVGFLCYTACPDTWSSHPEFPEMCYRCKDEMGECKASDMIVQKRSRVGTAVACKPGEEKLGGLCYQPCPAGYRAESNLCLKCL